MKVYEVAIPIISGFQVVSVNANNEEDAIKKIDSMDYWHSDVDKLKLDFDSNNWEIEEVEPFITD